MFTLAYLYAYAYAYVLVKTSLNAFYWEIKILNLYNKVTAYAMFKTRAAVFYWDIKPRGEAQPSGFRPDKTSAASFLNGFTNIPGKACVKRVHNNEVLSTLEISMREKHLTPHNNKEEARPRFYRVSSNSLIIHQSKTKQIPTVKEV